MVGRASGERFWLEVTRRPDLAENLKAPQNNEQGGEFWSYSLLKEVRQGDTIFHYDGIAQAIVTRSIATVSYWEDELLMGSERSICAGGKCDTAFPILLARPWPSATRLQLIQHSLSEVCAGTTSNRPRPANSLIGVLSNAGTERRGRSATERGEELLCCQSCLGGAILTVSI